MVLCNLLGGDGRLLAKLPPILSREVQFLSGVMEFLGKLSVVGAVIAVEQSLISGRDDQSGDIHGRLCECLRSAHPGLLKDTLCQVARGKCANEWDG